MAFFAIGDLHLAFSSDKPMDVFGEQWINHVDRIREAWLNKVRSEDVVLIPGDISWAMTLEEAAADLDWIGRLPGRKVLLRGNHDYWWSGISKVRRALAAGCYAIQNDAIRIDGVTVCGTRGWLLPSHPHFEDSDEPIYRREIERLRLSLKHASTAGDPIVAMIHYPPCDHEGTPTAFTQLLEAYGVQLCLYGHLHGPAQRFAFAGMLRGVRYQLVSADYIGFAPIQLAIDQGEACTH